MARESPSAVIFDLGGVVCWFRPERRLAALAEATGRNIRSIQAAIWDSGLDAAGDRGEIPRDELYQRIIDALGGELTQAQVRELWSTAFEPNRDVLALIERIPGRKVLLTNNGPVVGDCLAHELSDVGAIFDRVFLSYQFGGAKPDTVVFRGVERELGLQPQELVFIDDDPANADGAMACGWSGIHFMDVHQLERQLGELGVRLS